MPKRRIAKGAARSRAQIEAQLKAAKRSAELRRKHGSDTGPSAKRGLLRVDTSQPSGKADRVALKEAIGEGKTGPTGKRGKGGVARGRLSLSASAKVGRENVINDKDRVAYRAAGAESRKLKVKLGEHAPTADRIYSVAKRLAKVREGGNDVKIGDISKSAQTLDPTKKTTKVQFAKADIGKATAEYIAGRTTQQLKDDITPKNGGRALVVDPDYVDAIKAEIAKREANNTGNDKPFSGEGLRKFNEGQMADLRRKLQAMSDSELEAESKKQLAPTRKKAVQEELGRRKLNVAPSVDVSKVKSGDTVQIAKGGQSWTVVGIQNGKVIIQAQQTNSFGQTAKRTVDASDIKFHKPASPGAGAAKPTLKESVDKAAAKTASANKAAADSVRKKTIVGSDGSPRATSVAKLSADDKRIEATRKEAFQGAVKGHTPDDLISSFNQGLVNNSYGSHDDHLKIVTEELKTRGLTDQDIATLRSALQRNQYGSHDDVIQAIKAKLKKG